MNELDRPDGQTDRQNKGAKNIFMYELDLEKRKKEKKEEIKKVS